MCDILQGLLCVITMKTLTHWGIVTHICISKLTIIGSDNGLSPRRCQAIIWTNAVILLIWSLEINRSQILVKMYAFSFMKIILKMPFGKWRPFCIGLNVLTRSKTNSQYGWRKKWHYDKFTWMNISLDISQCVDSCRAPKSDASVKERPGFHQ